MNRFSCCNAYDVDESNKNPWHLGPSCCKGTGATVAVSAEKKIFSVIFHVRTYAIW